jgi:anhydro-N-acetylmuramic acid kinase
MDRDGRLAAQGKVQSNLLTAMLLDPYFQQSPPKSTGPEYFSRAWLQGHLSSLGAISAADVQATLVALTAESITRAIRSLAGFSHPEVFVCGGGAHNPALMRGLADRLAGCKVRPTDDLGIPADWVEAMAFAWLARQRLLGLPGNSPAVTGAGRSAVLGGLWLPG